MLNLSDGEMIALFERHGATLEEAQLLAVEAAMLVFRNFLRMQNPVGTA